MPGHSQTVFPKNIPFCSIRGLPLFSRGYNQPGSASVRLIECPVNHNSSVSDYLFTMSRGGNHMRLRLKDEMEYAIWKITGLSIPYNENVIPCLAQKIALETGEDPGEVSMTLSARIKEIIWEDVSNHYRVRESKNEVLEPAYE